MWRTIRHVDNWGWWTTPIANRWLGQQQNRLTNSTMWKERKERDKSIVCQLKFAFIISQCKILLFHKDIKPFYVRKSIENYLNRANLNGQLTIMWIVQIDNFLPSIVAYGVDDSLMIVGSHTNGKVQESRWWCQYLNKIIK